MIVLRFLLGLLIITTVGCANQFGLLKKDAQPTDGSAVQAAQSGTQRTPADEGISEQEKMKADLLKLQEENAALRAQILELQQKVANQAPKKKEKVEKVVEKPKEPVAKKDPVPVAKKDPAPTRKPSRVHKVATSKKQKKPKVIQISFEDEKNPTAKTN